MFIWFHASGDRVQPLSSNFRTVVVQQHRSPQNVVPSLLKHAYLVSPVASGSFVQWIDDRYVVIQETAGARPETFDAERRTPAVSPPRLQVGDDTSHPIAPLGRKAVPGLPSDANIEWSWGISPQDNDTPVVLFARVPYRSADGKRSTGTSNSNNHGSLKEGVGIWLLDRNGYARISLGTAPADKDHLNGKTWFAGNAGWLPSGHAVYFVYDSKLYTIKVPPQKK
jgi:hypothetical protein